MQPFQPSMRTFTLLWIGQAVSMLGSAMTAFALVIWAWDKTSEATPIVLIAFFAAFPAALTNLIAGPLVDRWSRKWTMFFGDLGVGLATLILLIVLLTGESQLQLWHLYLTRVIAGICGTFQSLAFTAGITTILPQAQYTRASSMMSLAEYFAMIGGPALAGLLVTQIGLEGIMLIDLITFLIAAIATTLVHIPQPVSEPEQEATEGNFWRSVSFGFRFIAARRGLVGLTVVMLAFLIFEGIAYPLLAPMILARTEGDAATLGALRSVMGIGGVVGGAVVTIWGGPKPGRRIHGVLIGLMLTGLLGDALMGLGRGWAVWVFAAFCVECFIPLAIGANHALWRSLVAAEAQGRVFAARSLIFGGAEPVATLLAGVLADNIFEPVMQPDGALAAPFGWLVGTGDGAGIALLFVFGGLALVGVGLLGYLWPAVRNIEAHESP